MPRLFRAALAALSLAALASLPATAHASDPPRVAIIVGPVGSLTPTYLALAERAASTAEAHGAVVARAYSPNATPANVLAAVAGANVVVYFGHGYGHPSPYGGLNTAKQNGWALQGPAARGTHADTAGQVAYYGEDWIVANARPAPGFVMIYSNTCYAPGASEGGHSPATPWQAAQRVAHYSRSTFALGGSAYYATDFDRGAADLLARLLGSRDGSFGTAFVSDHRYVPSGLSIQPHAFSAGQQIWLHLSKYTDGPPNYWYAFAGNPDLTPRRAWDRVAPTATLDSPVADAADVPPAEVVRVRFSEPVLGVGATTLTLRTAAGQAVPADVAYDAAGLTATIRPVSPLRLSERYEVVASSGIRDAAGRPLAETRWRFSTRLDADPWNATTPIVLESGTHELVRFAADGTIAETRRVDVRDRYWLTAELRARVLGQSGSWFRVADAAHAGWWIRENAAAHGLGRTEEALLLPTAHVALAPGDHAVVRFVGDVAELTTLVVGGGREVAVDRRIVLNGRTYVRLTNAAVAGAWIEIAADASPPEALVQRLLGAEQRGTPVTIALERAGEPIFRFDASGRVVDRRLLPPEVRALATSETVTISGSRYLVIGAGQLAGWALAETPTTRILTGTPAVPLD